MTMARIKATAEVLINAEFGDELVSDELTRPSQMRLLYFTQTGMPTPRVVTGTSPTGGR